MRKSDREILIESLPPQAGIVPQSALMVLSAADADWRNLMYEAAGSKGLHKWMVRTNWLLSRDTDVPTISDLEREVKDFVKSPVGEISELSSEKLLQAIKLKN